MLPLFDFNIAFSASRDYVRCITLAHLGATVLLLASSFHSAVILFCLLLLLISYIFASKTTSAQPDYKQLTYLQTCWVMNYHNRPEERYDSVRIAFDGGFFLLLKLSSTTTQKKVIVFNDQLTQEKRRRLVVLSRVR